MTEEEGKQLLPWLPQMLQLLLNSREEQMFVAEQLQTLRSNLCGT